MSTTEEPRHRSGAELVPSVGPQTMLGIGLAALLLSTVAVWAAATQPVSAVAAGLGGVGLLVLGARRLRRGWTWVVLLVLVIMFVPVHRYAIGGGLPVAIEPYRIVLFLALLGVAGSLAFIPGFTYRKTPFGWTIVAFLLASLLGVVMNGPELVTLGLAGAGAANVLNTALLFGVFFIVRQLLTSERRVTNLLVLLVWCGVVVGVASVIERSSGTNLFWSIGDRLPLSLLNETALEGRGGNGRSYGSAQHPIALAVMLVMILPMALYLAVHGPWPRNSVNRRIVYGLASLTILGGVGAAVSRTSVVAIGAAFIVILFLRPMLGFTLAALGLPILTLGYALQPKLITDSVFTFLNFDALIASQYGSPGSVGQGRLADVGPVSEAFQQNPLFGSGYGRIVFGASDDTLFILDNQYFATVLDAGLVGLVVLLALYLTPLVAMARLSLRRDVSAAHRDLALALMAGMTSFAASSYFFDAFAFVQAVYVWSMLLAVGGWLLIEHGAQNSRRARNAGRVVLEPA